LKAVYKIGLLNFRFRDKADAGGRYFREVQGSINKLLKSFTKSLRLYTWKCLASRSPRRNLQKLRAQPPQLQENIFEKLFSEAETAKLNPEEMKTYQESLKAFRDNQNAMDYMHQKGQEKGRLVARTQAATRLKQINLPVE
jgi:hypothetical protein